MILLSAPADYMTPCNKVRSFLLKPENPEEGSNMFTFKKEKEEAMSEEEKKMAQELGDAIGNLEEADLFYEEIEDSVELSPAEKLAYNIADHLAAVTAERFSDMIDGMDMDIAKQIVGRLQQSDAEALVGMLKAMFLVKGRVHATEELDLLGECEEYAESVYWRFHDTLFGQEVFEWFRINHMIQNCSREDCSAVIRIPLEVS